MGKLKTYVLYALISFVQLAIGQVSTDELTDNKVNIDGETFYLYTVEQSEGLFRISQKFGVSQQDILNANSGIEKGLKVNQVIRIPIIPGRNSSNYELKNSNKYIYHKVEKGQTLFYISRQYGVTEEEITKLNPGSERSLKIGYELRIPQKQTEKKPATNAEKFYYHEVKPKETLYFLSKKYNASVAEIVALNPGLESGIIQVGTTLKIPKGDANEKILIPTPEESEKTLEDKQYVYHRLQAGETLYAISKQYNVNINDLKESNGISDVTDIKTGYLLLIPKNEMDAMALITDDGLSAQKPVPDYVVHETGKNESLLYLSEKYNVDERKIIALNPDVKDRRWKKLRRRTEIKIPILKKVEEKVELNIDTDTNREKYIADSIWLVKSFATGCDTTSIKGAINVAYLGPFYLDKNDSVNIIEDGDSLGMPKYKERIPKEIFPHYNIFREFYFGSLLAIDSLKKLGISVNVHTYDVKRTPNDKYSLQQVLANPELKNMHVIFGPAHGNQVPEVAEFCRKNNIKLVLPFGEEHQNVEENPNLYCLNAKESLLYPSVSKHITEMYPEENIILVTGNTKGSRQDLFSAAMRDAIFRKRMDNPTSQSYYEVNFEQDGIAGIERLMDKNERNIVIIASEDKKLFNAILPSLYYLKNNKKYPVSLFGFPEWMMATSSDLKYMFELNTVVFNQFYVDYTDPQVLEVLNQYTHWFGAEPTITHPSLGILHPNNGLLGFDATLYFVQGIKMFGASFDRCMPKLEVELTESDFYFKRENPWGGFSNKHINFINFSDDYNLYMMGSQEN